MSRSVARQLITSDGVRLHVRQWAAVSEPTGVVVGLHGIQSHAQWYDYSSERLAMSGLVVYFCDRRGSGLNGFRRGHADHGMRLLNDVRQVVRLARREHSGLPVTMMGLSWGGKIAAAYAAQYPDTIDRLALLYPGLRPKFTPSPVQRLQLWLARRHDVRDRPVSIPLQDPALFTDDPIRQQEIINDPLALSSVTSGFINAGLDLDRMIQRCRSNLTHPVLLMLAGRDRIIDNEATRRLVNSWPSRQVTTVNYKDAAHTLEFEADRDCFIHDLRAWLTAAAR